MTSFDELKVCMQRKGLQRNVSEQSGLVSSSAISYREFDPEGTSKSDQIIQKIE